MHLPCDPAFLIDKKTMRYLMRYNYNTEVIS